MAREYQLHSSRGPASGIDYKAELNEAQYAAVTSTPGQALVIAGAGSGKTRTLTYRVAYLLDNGILPENILLLTFTNKAANEMLERVRTLLNLETVRLWGGTFHSIGNRLLRLHCERLGYRRGFSIMDREDQGDLIETVISAAAIDKDTLKFPKAEVLADMFSLADNICCPLQEIIDTRYPYFDQVADGIHKVQAAYKEKKLETNSMDFDDLLVLVVRLLAENDDLRAYYQRQFQFVLVDEFQDTNTLQSDLVDMLAGPNGNLMVVGDDAQSIYSWRGADVTNILNFDQRYPLAKTYKIETNYRSVPEVLALANDAIDMNRGQIRKSLIAARASKGMLPALLAVDSSSAQAEFIAQRITELQDEGVELDEIAIIYRAHYHSLEIQMELASRGIPFAITSGLRFFEQAHVKDVAAFMKFAVNRQDEVSFLRMVRLIPGVGTASAVKLWRDWMKLDVARDIPMPGKFSDYLLSMKVPAKAKETWEQVAYTLDELMQEGMPVLPAAMIPSIVEGVYKDYMNAKFKNAEQRMQDLEKLEEFSTRYDDPMEFLGQLALLSGVDTDNAPAADTAERKSVTLTTGHQAKGLEWNVVFLVWLAEGMFPNKRVLDEGGEVGIEEERRLFYVMATRAKDELYLMYPVINHHARDGTVVMRPSRFLADLSPGLTETWNVRSFK
jgi:DNA helicase-2/ATP-dependent DNA helicase PcrA